MLQLLRMRRTLILLVEIEVLVLLAYHTFFSLVAVKAGWTWVVSQYCVFNNPCGPLTLALGLVAFGALLYTYFFVERDIVASARDMLILTTVAVMLLFLITGQQIADAIGMHFQLIP